MIMKYLIHHCWKLKKKKDENLNIIIYSEYMQYIANTFDQLNKKFYRLEYASCYFLLNMMQDTSTSATKCYKWEQ